MLLTVTFLEKLLSTVKISKGNVINSSIFEDSVINIEEMLFLKKRLLAATFCKENVTNCNIFEENCINSNILWRKCY